jgi:hypothetical protein
MLGIAMTTNIDKKPTPSQKQKLTRDRYRVNSHHLDFIARAAFFGFTPNDQRRHFSSIVGETTERGRERKFSSKGKGGTSVAEDHLAIISWSPAATRNSSKPSVNQPRAIRVRV